MEKIAKEYLKLYHDPEKTKLVYTYTDMDDYLNQQLETYHWLEEKAKEEDRENNIFIYLTLIQNPYLLGLAIAFQRQDYELLNNAIYHDSKHSLLKLPGGGYDHSGDFWSVIDAMACNNIEALEACLPVELGLGKNGYPAFVVANNLLMALWYNNEAWMKTSYPAGVKMLKQKKSLWEKAIVSFLIALADRNMHQASEALSNLCKSSRRIQRPKLYKCLAIEAHGLYQIARHLLSEDDFNQIEMPDNHNFCKGLVNWQKEHNYPEKGELIVDYPGELQFMNRILKLPLPKNILKGTGKRQMIDTDRMEVELMELYDAKR